MRKDDRQLRMRQCLLIIAVMLAITYIALYFAGRVESPIEFIMNLRGHPYYYK